MLYSIAYRQRSGSLQFEHGDNNVCAKLLHCTTIIPELLLYMTAREKKTLHIYVHKPRMLHTGRDFRTIIPGRSSTLQLMGVEEVRRETSYTAPE